DQPELATQSAAWLLNGKAVTQQSLAERALLARASTDPATADLAEQARAVRRQLAALTLAAPRPGQEAERLRQLGQLGERLQELDRRLGQATGRAARTDPWVELAEVRKALSADAVFIDIARFPVLNFRAKDRVSPGQPARYAAWVIAPEGRG